MRAAVLGFGFLLWAATSAGAEIDFNRDIRPILSDNCFVCHGPNEADRQAGLRLDDKESALGETDSGSRAIVPGAPDQSALIQRILSQDDSERMPPKESGKELKPAQISLLRDWIKAGASWKEHWSFVVPTRPEPPASADHAWPRNPIDHFILARLHHEGISPSPPADRATLLRRVTFDLTGLPPSPAELDAFLSDTSTDAYESVVDRLLSSNRYGEHMARFWLDAARYGDTHGLHLDNYREMWPYRDWVVQAFNDNLSYDQFTIQQLAGDLLPQPTQDQLIATGFNRSHVTTNEGGSIKEEVYVRNVVDRVVTLGTVFMGMTFECTRCHDHKYDPFTMNDFYSMFAFFNSIDGSPLDGNRKDHAPVLRVPSEQQRAALDELERHIEQLEKKLASPWEQVDNLQRAWEQDVLASRESQGDTPVAIARLSLGDWFTVGPFEDNRRYVYGRRHGPEGKPIDLRQRFELATGDSIGWEAKPEWVDGKIHRALPGGIAANFLYRSITSPNARQIAVSLGTDDAVKVYLNNREVLAKNVTRQVAPDQEQLELSLREGKNDLLIKVMNFGGDSGFYFAVKSEELALPDEILKIVQRSAAERSLAEREQLRSFFRNKIADDENLATVRSELELKRSQRAEIDRKVATTLVWREAKEPKQAYYLNRGEYDQKRDPMTRRTPSSLAPMGDDLPRDRLGLARWLVDPKHPLTARVAVNRFWQQLFGTGIVKTAEDFGSQGEPPSHPELLDWLATRFIADGWNVRQTMKRMVMSATYRQTSRASSTLYTKDPENRLLARGPRYRLDAEMLRDQALALSGLLVQRLGGPSVKPPQPEGLWFAVGYSGSNTVRFSPDSGPDKVHRRTLYTFIKRTAPPPQMSIVDAPSRESCVVRRERTNTPLLSLLLFNDPQYVEAARAMAERTMREGGSRVVSRAVYLFRLCTARYPSNDELDDLVRGYQTDLAEYEANPNAAKQLVQLGTVPAGDAWPVTELAAWTMTANMLLNLDEVVTKN